MKIYMIQLPDGQFLKNNKYAFRWNGDCKGTTVVEDARHYKTQGIAEGVIKSKITEREKFVGAYKRRVTVGWITQEQYDKQIQSNDSIIERYKALTVVEGDVEVPSFISGNAPDIKFDNHDNGVVVRPSFGNASCKCCGIYFKKVPVMEFGAKNKARLCPWCIVERAELAQKTIDEMNEEYKEIIEAERFVHRMD